MSQDINRLLMELERSMREANREIINPKITELTLDGLEASVPFVEMDIDGDTQNGRRLLDVLEEEEAWVALERDREPRSREELAGLIDRSVLDEARAMR